jgi:hypothetical protein
MDNLSAATILKPLPNPAAAKMPRVTVLLMKLEREQLDKRRWYGCYCVDHEPADRLPWIVSMRCGANIDHMGAFESEGRALLFLAIHNNWRIDQ